MTPLSRRTLLTTAGATALAAAAPEAAAAAKAKKKARRPAARRVDVCVVGAGLAGLTAAGELLRKGLSVHVIEADTRVGGRVWTGRAKDGTPLNYGATFVGPTQDRIARLAKELGVQDYPTYNTGENVLYFGGRRAQYTGTIPPLDPAVLVEAQLAIDTIDGMAAQVDPAAPWKAAKAAEWDGQTFETFKLANTVTPGARKLLDLAINAIFSVESREVSLLFVLSYVAAAGSLNLLVDTGGGAQERMFAGGTMQIPEKLAQRLGKGRVTVHSPVRTVVTKGLRTTVISDKITVSARRVVVAVPPPMITRIEFRPGLAALKDQLFQHLPLGSIGKSIAIYDEAWWRKKGLTGQATSDAGPINATFDISPDGGKPGVMMGFVDGQDAREFSRLGKDERRRRCLDQFALYFGDEARSPREYEDMLWDELPLHRGCPVTVPGPGVLTGFGPVLHEPDGAIHFASTELATVWTGYMDGAIQSGQVTAAAVAEELS